MSDKPAAETPERVVERGKDLLSTFVLRADLLRDALHSAGAMQTGWRVTEAQLREWTDILKGLVKLATNHVVDVNKKVKGGANDGP